jgi:hypothetical protein
MNILFLPIDIDLTVLNFTQVDNSIKLESTYNPYWDSTIISEDTILKTGFDKVLNQLPFKKITVLTHKIQQRVVGPHVDVYPEMLFEDGEFEHIKQNEPSGYRIVIKGASDSIEVFNGKTWVTATTPTTPCCYVLNATTARHRVKEDLGRTMIYVRGFLDIDKHQELLNKSYSKYKDYAIELIK